MSTPDGDDGDSMEVGEAGSDSGSEGDDQESEATGERLECDESAYVMYHKAETESSCLSFDILRDKLGDDRVTFPHTCYVVAGTQTPNAYNNRVIVMKMSNMHATEADKTDDEEEDESSDDDDDEKMAEMETATMRHNDSVNRIRVTEAGDTSLAATWSSNGTVYIWKLTRPLEAVDDPAEMTTYTKNNESPSPVYYFSGHQTEGYGMDWSPLIPGQLLTGDCNKNIHMWTPREGSQWTIDQRPFTGHSGSVEDIQWSPSESNVFSSCSVDKSLRIWDTRASPHKACMLTLTDAHDMDINVLNWNRNEPFIVTGGDDGVIKIWDLRQFKKAVATLKHHTAPITSVEWHPTDGSVFAASASDDKLTIWDLAVERDPEQDMGQDTEDENVPSQLLFVHQGQKDIKELHWHRQIPGMVVSTAVNGFNVFKTISV